MAAPLSSGPAQLSFSHQQCIPSAGAERDRTIHRQGAETSGRGRAVQPGLIGSCSFYACTRTERIALSPFRSAPECIL